MSEPLQGAGEQTSAPTTSTAPGVRPRTPLLPRRSYIPLVTLVVLSALMAGLGVATTRGWLDAEAVGVASTPESCRSEVVPGDPTIWTGPRTPESEAVFAENTADLPYPGVPGRDGFVFWSDIQANNFSDMLGRAPWLDEQRDQWRDYFDDLQAGLAREGTDLIVVVAPSSGAVYPEMLPDWAQPLRGLTHFDQLLEVSGDLPIVDVRGDLQAAAEDEWVYSAVNSHWTPYGASVAWESISDCLQDLYPNSDYDGLVSGKVVEVERQAPPNEFAEWGVEAPRDDWTVPTLDPEPVVTTRTAADGTESELSWPGGVDLLELPVTTAGGEIPKKALVVGDSQGTALSAFWAGSFESTFQIRHHLDDPSQRANVLHAARTSGADLVVFELTERYLSLQPPTILS
ncbi:alginate O-acetyltransferase AlgX-related protein [Oerskovia enterophila]|uniref:alginate O-acetyltransferase AlgX-related protein n=1 Tax=Oerskovia enterophila TaxID=43678 RepID=UPI003393B0AF